ncbi:MAG: TIR domain-containing protein [Halioglobus sp.]
MNTPFPAYRGDQDYLFVCYSHADADIVYADMEALRQNNINLWYDEGISAGLSWRGEIANAIPGAKKLLFFISSSSLQSTHCLREVHFAIDHDIEIIPIYLEKCELPPELALVFSRVQALFRFSDNRYLEHVLGAINKQGTWAESFKNQTKKSNARANFGSIAAALFIVFLGYAAFDYFNSKPHKNSISDELQAKADLEAQKSRTNSPEDMSIAVLPLANLSTDAENAYFAAGIHEEILHQLVKIDAMKVTSREAVLRYADSEQAIREIASELNVGTIMTGSVRFSGNKVRIKTELVRAPEDVYLWAESYEFELDDIFAIQTDVALKVVAAMQTSLLPGEIESIRRPPTESTEAYALYLKYRYQLQQESGSSTLDEDGWIEAGIGRLQEAIEIDPKFARGHAELGYVKWLKGQIKLDEETQLYNAAVSHAQEAIAIDPSITTAYETLARVAFDRLEWKDWKSNALKSVELDDLDGRAAFSFAMTLANVGQYAQAHHWYEVAISKNPSIPYYREAAIVANIWGGDYARALAQTEQYIAVGGDKNAYHAFRAYTQSRLGLNEESQRSLAKMSEAPMLVAMWATPGYRDYLRCKAGEATAVLSELAQISIDAARELRIQHCAAGANDVDALFASFDRTIEDGQIIYLTDLITDEIKNDPRWQPSADYMNYPQATAKLNR